MDEDKEIMNFTLSGHESFGWILEQLEKIKNLRGHGILYRVRVTRVCKCGEFFKDEETQDKEDEE